MVQEIRYWCKKRGKTVALVERELGFGNGTIRNWDKNEPSMQRVQKVASLLNVPLEELTGIKEPPQPEAEAEESDPVKRQLYDLIDSMSAAKVLLLLEKAKEIEKI